MLTRNAIINVAIKRMSYYGIEKTNLRDLSDALKVRNTALYGYFQNKAELVIAVITSILDEESAQTLNMQKDDTSLRDLIESMVGVRYRIFRKYNRLYQSSEYLEKIGFYQQMTDVRIAWVNKHLNRFYEGGDGAENNNGLQLKERLLKFIFDLDRVFTDNAPRRTINGETDDQGFIEISNLLGQMTSSLLLDIEKFNGEQ